MGNYFLFSSVFLRFDFFSYFFYFFSLIGFSVFLLTLKEGVFILYGPRA
jgi:hypothetical protein